MRTYRATTFDHKVPKGDNPYGIFEVDVADDDEFWEEAEKQLEDGIEVLEVVDNG